MAVAAPVQAEIHVSITCRQQSVGELIFRGTSLRRANTLIPKGAILLIAHAFAKQDKDFGAVCWEGLTYRFENSGFEASLKSLKKAG